MELNGNKMGDLHCFEKFFYWGGGKGVRQQDIGPLVTKFSLSGHGKVGAGLRFISHAQPLKKQKVQQALILLLQQVTSGV